MTPVTAPERRHARPRCRRADIPEGFKPRSFGGGFIAVNGPLYLKKLDARHAAGLSRRAATLQPDGHLPRRHDGHLLRHAAADLGALPVGRSGAALPADHQPAGRLPGRRRRSAPGCRARRNCCAATRSLVFMQGLVTADGENVARVSGIFKIGPRFEDAVDSAREVQPPHASRCQPERPADVAAADPHRPAPVPGHGRALAAGAARTDAARAPVHRLGALRRARAAASATASFSTACSASPAGCASAASAVATGC